MKENVIRDILYYDLETDSPNPEEANLKWFGGYSMIDQKFYMYEYTEKKEIQKLIDRHRVFIGFNNKGFDNVVLERSDLVIGKYKVIIDLWEVCAPRGNRGFGKKNKDKLAQMGITNLKNYKLKTIIETLKLDKEGKGEIDYNIFKKDKWTQKEIKEIKKYLKQDLVLPKKLFEWLEEQYDPIKKFLPEKAQRNFKHLTCSSASVGYQIICEQADLEYAWEDNPKPKKFFGAHEILNRKEKYKGNLICIDFASMYPHCITQANLFSIQDSGWNGAGYFKIDGFVDNKKQGKIESVIKSLLRLRLMAKKSGDKVKSKGLKLIINAIYGLSASPLFKSMYNEFTPGNTTRMARTIIKRLAKTLEGEDFEIIYGFTDSVYCVIPPESNEKELMYIVDKFIKEVKSNLPFPADTFKLDVEKRMKFIWFNARKSYLYVTDEDKLHYTENILNKNTPKVIMKLFDEYMKPKIIKELDVNFNRAELITGITAFLKKDIELAGEEYKVGSPDSYDSKTCLHFQIAEAYGEGQHTLIKNTAMIGIGKNKGTKKIKPVRYCTISEFRKNKLKVSDIDLKKLIQHLKPFIKIKKEINKTL